GERAACVPSGAGPPRSAALPAFLRPARAPESRAQGLGRRARTAADRRSRIPTPRGASRCQFHLATAYTRLENRVRAVERAAANRRRRPRRIARRSDGPARPNRAGTATPRRTRGPGAAPRHRAGASIQGLLAPDDRRLVLGDYS